MDFKELTKKHIFVNIVRKTVLRNIAPDLHFGQIPFLRYISEHEGCTQYDIARFFHVTPASIAQSTKRMEKSGLISRAVDETNARRNKLSLTEEGVKTFSEVRGKFDEVDRRMYVGFSDEELDKLSEFYDRIIANLTGKKQKMTPELYDQFQCALRELEGARNGKTKK